MTYGRDVAARSNSARARNVEVRRLSPELIPGVVEIHMDAFKGFTNARVGRRYVRAFLRWFHETDGAIALAAVDRDETPLGYVVGIAADDWYLLTRHLMPSGIAGIASRPWLLLDARVRSRVAAWVPSIRRPAKPRSGLPHGADPTMDLVAIAVSSRAEGMGIGSRLLKEFDREALELGIRVVRLSVHADNVAARRLYERCGWRAVEGSDPQHEVEYRKTLPDRNEPEHLLRSRKNCGSATD